MTDKEFKIWPKTQRLVDRETEEWPQYVITEKLDGSNALVYISQEEDLVLAGSRNKWITPEQDNFGFAKWVVENREELKKLGNGYHYGEWIGAGIQRRYGLDHKRLYLFHCSWRYEKSPSLECQCVYYVPVVSSGPIQGMLSALEGAEFEMRGTKSLIESFTRPEGLILEIPAWGVRRKIVWDK